MLPLLIDCINQTNSCFTLLKTCANLTCRILLSIIVYVCHKNKNKFIEQHKNNAEYQRCVYRYALALDPWVKWGLFRVETGNVIELFFYIIQNKQYNTCMHLKTCIQSLCTTSFHFCKIPPPFFLLGKGGRLNLFKCIQAHLTLKIQYLNTWLMNQLVIQKKKHVQHV